MTYNVLEIEATRLANASHGTITKEQAVARLLETNPEAYAAHAAQHNAKGMLSTLEAAGVQIVRR